MLYLTGCVVVGPALGVGGLGGATHTRVYTLCQCVIDSYYYYCTNLSTYII